MGNEIKSEVHLEPSEYPVSLNLDQSRYIDYEY